jgi:hypothetical protein
VVLAAGIAAVLIVFLRNTGTSLETPKRNEPVQVVKKEKQIPLERAAREVAGRFVLTAVLRRNLDQAWKITGPGLRAGITYKQWLTGNIPVVPFTHKLDVAPMKIDVSRKDYALLEIALLAKSKKIKPEYYIIELVKTGKGKYRRWVVNSWTPRARPALPANPAN